MISDGSKPVNKTRPFFTAIPDDIAVRGDVPPTAKLVAGSIFSRTFLRRKTGFVLLRASWIAEDWGLSADSVTRALKLLADLDVIEIRRTPAGNEIRFVSIPQIAESDSAECGGSFRNLRSAIPQIADTHSAKSGIHPYTVTYTDTQTEEEGTRESVTESQSETNRTKLPSAPSLSFSDRILGMINLSFPANPNAVLQKIRMAGWDERRVEAALMKTDPSKGVNYFAGICRSMTDADISQTLSPTKAKKGKSSLSSEELESLAARFANLK